MRRLVLLYLLLTMPLIGNADDHVTLDEVTNMYEKEKQLDGAAVELFMALREKYGPRLRTAGGLIFCREPEAAAIIQPSIKDMMLDANDFVEKIDLKKYGMGELERKQRMELIRRAITGTTVYMLSGDENGQFFFRVRRVG